MKEIFCTHCRAVTPHAGEVDHNGEHVYKCATFDCPGFVKFPQVETGEELEQLIADREEVNKPIAEAMEATRKQQAIQASIATKDVTATITHEEEPEDSTEKSEE